MDKASEEERVGGGGQQIVAELPITGSNKLPLMTILHGGSADSRSKSEEEVSVSTSGKALVVDSSTHVLDKGRLPRAIRPLKYDLTVAPDLETSKLAGIVVVHAECLASTKELWLHSDPAVVWEALGVSLHVNLKDGSKEADETVAVRNITSFQADQVVKVELMQELSPGALVEVAVKFSSVFSDKLVGFYKARYTENGKAKVLGVTHLWPTEARRMFPCFDEPELKAQFLVRMQRPAGLAALSNMPVESTESVPVSLLNQTDNIFQDNFVVTPKMSTYLLAMALSDFGNVNASSDSVNADSSTQDPLVRVWMPAPLAEQGRLAVSIAPPILRFYESLFAIPYPLPKMDLFVAPDLAYGAMENWGLITYRAQKLLFDPKVSTANDQVEVASTIAHEISHQWFGNLVTPKWWTDLWLNEGFASYMEIVPIQSLYPRWNVGDTLYSEKLRGVLVTDSLRASHPISKDGVSTTDEIMELFDDISYRKGSSLIRMIVSMMGREAFFKALSAYLRAFAYGNASQDDLWHHLTVADGGEGGQQSRLPPGVELKEIMDSWTLQTGYPVVTVSRSKSEGQDEDLQQLGFFQSRFFLHPVGPNDMSFEEKSASKWWIPLNFAFGSSEDAVSGVDPVDWTDSRPHGWLTPSSPGCYTSVTEPTRLPSVKPNAWVVMNVGHTGYYRVNYDETNWRLLAAQLRKNHLVIDAVNRAQILDDVMMLARAGYVAYDIALDVLSYLEKEREYLPWSAALDHFKFLMNMLKKQEDSSDHDLLKKYLLVLMNPALSEVKLDEASVQQGAMASSKEGRHYPAAEDSGVYENLERIWYRSLLLKWGCTVGHERILSDAKATFSKWMRSYDPDHPDDSTVVKPNEKETVYCYGIKEGGKEAWDFAVAHLGRTLVASEKELILSALACSEDPEITTSYVDAIIASVSGSSFVDNSDAMTGILTLAANSQSGRDLLLRLITSDWDKVRGLFGTGRKNVGRVFVQLARASSSEKTLELIEEFEEQHSDALHGAGLLMQTATELLSANIRWQKEQSEEFVEGLKKRVS